MRLPSKGISITSPFSDSTAVQEFLSGFVYLYIVMINQRDIWAVFVVVSIEMCSHRAK
ncbi:hypothetical protein DsansV1_C11g0111361 [Dioscorea sansibarensis]